MRLIWTIIWALLISGAVSYVLSSMAGETFDMTGTLALAGIFVVTIFVLGSMLKETNEY
ncbi:MAG TPA: DUF2929 family protein [Bacillota bacterium]|nr:DUF2929 family protein [Bacillota bacterium]